jgi:cell division protein FtsB
MPTKLSRTDQRRFNLFLMVVVIATIGLILFSPFGINRALKTRWQLREVKEENGRLLEQNEALKKEITRLERDPDYLEKVAREKHGLLKKGEMVFEFKDNKRVNPDKEQ